MKNRLKIRSLGQRYTILLLIISALSACDEQLVYNTFQPLPTTGWQRKDTLLFHVKVQDSLTYYKMSVAIRNRTEYPYQNINLSVSHSGPDSIAYPPQEMQLTLANKEGRWEGKGWGGLYQKSFPAGSIHIEKPGIYSIRIAYTLPDSILQGINDIGVKLER